MMQIKVAKDPLAVASMTVDFLVGAGEKALKRKEGKGTYNLALPTGSTPIETYRELIERHNQGRISDDFIARMRTWNLDEYLPDPGREVWPHHEQSHRTFMERHFFRFLPFAPGANRILDPAAADLGEECRGYEQSIAVQGGLDLALVGIGTNGHVAFNEPRADADSHTGVVHLAPTTVSDNAEKFFKGDLNAVPKQALSMGLGTILSARKVILIATGHAKAVAVGASVLGPVTGWCPASLFQNHADCTYVLDTEAASLLIKRAAGPDGRLAPGTSLLRSEAGFSHSLIC